MSYGSNITDAYRQVGADTVEKLRNGEVCGHRRSL
jgi:hypothetical protein